MILKTIKRTYIKLQRVFLCLESHIELRGNVERLNKILGKKETTSIIFLCGILNKLLRRVFVSHIQENSRSRVKIVQMQRRKKKRQYKYSSTLPQPRFQYLSYQFYCLFNHVVVFSLIFTTFKSLKVGSIFAFDQRANRQAFEYNGR